MASAVTESPLRRVAKQLANRGNSPVEVNRFKALLRKKIGEDATPPSSPKKAATPRKEIKVKRGATVKLCSGCENHNQDAKAKPKVAKNPDGEVARKTRAAKKNAEAETQGQTADPADGASGPVEKKAAAKKPRETKKKAVAQGEKLGVPSTSGTVQSDSVGPVEMETTAKKPRETKKKAVAQGEKLGVPSTSGTAQSDSEGSALTDSGTQIEGGAKPKRQRRKSATTVQEDEPESSVGKEKGKRKEVLKVKVAAPRKKTNNVPEEIGKTTLENMNNTESVDAAHQGDDIQMQNSDGDNNSTVKSKSTKSSQGTRVNPVKKLTPDLTINETLHNQVQLPADDGTSSKRETKTKKVPKSKLPRPKKTNKTIPEDLEKLPFDNMDVTDLVTSIQQGEETAAEKSGTSNTTKSKATNMNKGKHVSFMNSSNSDNTLVDADEPSDNLVGSSVAKESSKGKAKAQNATKAKSHPKKTTKNLPEDNPDAGFEDMNVTDLVNSIHKQREDADKSSSSTKSKSRKPTKASAQKTDNSVNSNSLLHNANKSADNSVGSLKNNSHNEDVIEDSEDMFKDDSVNSIQKRMEAMDFSSSNKTASKDKGNSGNSSTDVSVPQSENSFQKTSAVAMHGSFEDTSFSGFNIETNYEEMPGAGITGASAGEMINLSASTNLSHNDLEHSMDINNIEERSDNHPSIHNDETFYNDDFSNVAVDNIEVAHVTLRTRINGKRNKADSSKSIPQENTSCDGVISFFAPENRINSMTQNVLNQSDQNQQPSIADIEELTQVKSEPTDDFPGTSTQSLPSHETSMPSGSSENHEISHEKSQKKASKSAEPKSKAAKKLPAKTSKATEPTIQKSKNLEKDLAKEPSKEAAPKSADKSVNKSSHQESESSPKKKSQSRKHDETLCDKHKNSKKDDRKRSHRLAKEKKSDRQLKKDMKVAKAMATMSEHFSRISIGTTIGTINELHIGKLSSDSDSSCECSTDCSCSDYTSESNSSGGHCKCWKCLMTHSDPSSSESSSSEEDDDESNDESNSSESASSSSSSSSDEEIRVPKRMCSTKGAKSSAKPTYKEKLSKFCSKYDLRSNSSHYGLRSRDK